MRDYHYSGKQGRCSSWHVGVYLDGSLEGALSFGRSIFQRQTCALVTGTKWNEVLELHRMAFSPRLPRNSESRALAVTMRLLRRYSPATKWVLSYADATQCGDGTIYRAAGFDLTGITRNQSVGMLDGKPATRIGLCTGAKRFDRGGSNRLPDGFTILPGYQLRYIHFLHASERENLTVPVLPYSAIREAGAGMYRGQPRANT